MRTKKRAANKLPKELSFGKQMAKIQEDLAVKQMEQAGVVVCPTCKRGYLLEEEKEKIAEVGECSPCHYKRDMPFAVDGEFCSLCGQELDVELDEDWDEGEFRTLPYLWCPRCQRRVATSPAENELSPLTV